MRLPNRWYSVPAGAPLTLAAIAATLAALGPSASTNARVASKIASASCFRGGAADPEKYQSFYMERLPYIDEHAITVDADAARHGPPSYERCAAIPPNRAPHSDSAIGRCTPRQRLALGGRHPFSIYEWIFELDDLGPHRTRVRSQTWAAFPGIHGKIYRALVISSGGHAVAVRQVLKRIAGQLRPRPDVLA